MTTTPGNRKGVEYDEDGFPKVDPSGKVAPRPGESWQAACVRWAEEDEFEEDPQAAARASAQLAALRDEELFVEQLNERSFEDLPRAVRRLYRQNPSNPAFRRLYDSVMRELFERTDDKLRGSLLDSVDTMREIMEEGEKDSDRLKAAVYIFERLRGKTPEVIEHRQDKPFQVVLERLVSGPRIAAAERTALGGSAEPIEAEIVAETLSGPEASPERPDRASQAEIKRRIRKLTAPTPEEPASKPRPRIRRKTQS